MSITVEALDALGVALATHDHVWTPRERLLYERAVTFESRKAAGLSASGSTCPVSVLTEWIVKLPVGL